MYQKVQSVAPSGPYVHREYPKALYHPVEPGVRKAQDPDHEKQARAEGWCERKELCAPEEYVPPAGRQLAEERAAWSIEKQEMLQKYQDLAAELQKTLAQLELLQAEHADLKAEYAASQKQKPRKVSGE